MGKKYTRVIAILLIAIMLAGLMPPSVTSAQALTEEDLAKLPDSEIVISDLEKEGAELNPEAALYGEMKSVIVEGEKFSKAVRFTTKVQPQSTYLFQYVMPIKESIQKDDVLLAAFYARTISSTHETAEGSAALVMERKESWDKSINEYFSIPTQWKRFLIPIKAALLMEENNSQLTFRLGYTPQVVEIADFSLVNYKKQIPFEELPSTPIYYEGMEDDASWRAEANARIEAYRKGDMEITIRDQNGNPITGAQVQVKMTEHDFKFGTAVNSNLIFGTDENSEIYREKLKENFNSVVMENEMKWPWWEKDKAKTVNLYNWLGEQGLTVRGHNLLWDSSSRLPVDIGGLLNSPEQLNKRIKDHIHETAGYFKGRLSEWDVLNEPVLNNMIRGVYGDQIAVEWFKEAKEADPNAKLFVNETQILGLDAPVIGNFSNILQSLNDHNAPLDGVGIQAHFGSTPVSPMAFYDQITHFTQYANEIAITEFDMNTAKEDIQGKFTHDILLATFSHPNVSSFTMWGFWDGAHWQNNAPLFRNDWTLKPSGEEWQELIYNTWWTEVAGTTNSDGIYKLRGFYGDYDITVNYGGTSHTMKASLLKNQSNQVNIEWGKPSIDEPEVFVPLAVPDQTSDITSPVWPYGEAFNALEISPTSVKLTWPVAYDNIGVDSYQIYRNGELLTQVSNDMTSYDVTNLDSSQAYSFTLAAVDQAGNQSVLSPILKVDTAQGLENTIPGWIKGSALTIEEITESGAKLSWPAAIDNVGVQGYRIYMNGKIAEDTEDHSYRLSGLTANTQYTVRIEARDDSGNLSLGGPIVTFKTLPMKDSKAPSWSQPNLVTSNIGANSVDLEWSSAQDETEVSAYRIFEATKELITIPASDTSFHVTGLTEGTEYTFKVEAVDHSDNWTVAGPELTVRTYAQDAEAPDWPASRMMTYTSLSDHTVTLKWTPGEDNVGVISYRLYRDNASVADLSADENSYTFMDLQAAQQYVFRVEAGDAAGNWSATGPSLTIQTANGVERTEQTIFPSMDTFIQAPAKFGEQGTNNNLNYLRFKNAAGVSGLEETKNIGNNRRVFMQFPLDTVTGSVYDASLHLYVYAVQTPNKDIGMNLYKVGDNWTETSVNWINQPVQEDNLGNQVIKGNSFWVNFSVKDYVKDEAKGDQAISFKLQDDIWTDQNVDIYSKEASNAMLRPYLLVSTEGAAVDNTPPVWTDKDLKILDTKPNTVKLVWEGASDDSGINGFNIYQDNERIATLGADLDSYEVNGLNPSTMYHFKVEAVDANQESTDGPEAVITTLSADITPPVWPEGSLLTTSDVSRFEVKLHWTSAKDDETGIAEYVVYNGNELVAVLPGSVLEYKVTGLSAGVEYLFRIVARDAAGNETSGPSLSLNSEDADITSPFWSSGAALVQTVSTHSGIGLSWDSAQDNTGIFSYQIYANDLLVAEISGEVNRYFVTGLQPDSEYMFSIIAVDAAGNMSIPLDLTSAKTRQLDTITPQWTTGSRITAEFTEGQVELLWDAAIDNVGIEAYNLYRNGALESQLSPDLTHVTLLETTKTAVYKVEALDWAGNWTVLGPSTKDPVIPVPDDTTPPGWPLGSTLTAVRTTQNSIELSWTAAVDRIGVTMYKLLMNGNVIATTDTTSWFASGLQVGTEYEFKVEASDAADNWSSDGPGLKARTLDNSSGGENNNGNNSGSSGEEVLPHTKPIENMPITMEEGRVLVSIPVSDITVDKGFAKAQLNTEVLATAFSKVMTDKSGMSQISIELPKMTGISGYAVDIPAYYLTRNGKSNNIELITSLGRLILPGNMLINNLSLREQDNVTVSIAYSQVDPGSALVGRIKNVLDLNVSVDGNPLIYNNDESKVVITVPCLLTADERNAIEFLSVWYIDGNGQVSLVPSGRYLENTGQASFITSHFGKFPIVYYHKTFDDLISVEWARKAIEGLASKGFVNGVTDQSFNPKIDISRADFVKILVDTLKLAAEIDSTFTDVKQSDYYYEAVNIARKLDIVKGKGDNHFSPTEQISRQDMIAMIYRALALKEQHTLTTSDVSLSGFSDREQVSAYAEKGIVTLIAAGLVQGNAGRLEPLRSTTRAEAASILYRVFNYVLAD